MEKAVEVAGLSYSYSYSQAASALINIDLDIFEGESVGIIGPNGSGKSTLLKIIEGKLTGEGFVRVSGTIGTDLQELEGEILCLDGPTLNLDAKNRSQVIEQIREREGTKIIATQDLDLVFETCSRVILMNAGEIIRQGNAMEIMGDSVLLEENDLEQPERLAQPKKPGFYPLGNN